MKSQSVAFENTAGRLIDDARGFLRIIWHPNVTDSVTRRALMEELINQLIRTGYGRVLADQRFMAPLTDTEQQWVNGHLLPWAIREGCYRCRAILTARDAVARLASAAVIMPTRDLIPYCYFDDEAEAEAWLLAQ